MPGQAAQKITEMMNITKITDKLWGATHRLIIAKAGIESMQAIHLSWCCLGLPWPPGYRAGCLAGMSGWYVWLVWHTHQILPSKAKEVKISPT